ncbi:hybrid sensor histidine kinase/response regulator [Massilia soli]|uniref:histidine kinase n=1 Tax=Massilia soli TaxID=2792854 RepID=A0ABS7SMK0_9BURK|nr:response regulator [Massilia soli]MBZ2207397.1 response regulator [Massilia soli]
MKKLVTSADQLAGVFVGLLGLVVAVRWVFNSDTIAMLVPGSAKMGIVSPVLFMAAGFCCYFALRRDAGPALGTAWRILAVLLMVVPTLVLAQHLFGISLGIDFVRVPTAPTADTPYPGRMAPNTCIAFLLAGTGLLLARAALPSPSRVAALGACALALIVIGASALVGYILKLELMYRIAAANVMQPPTAVGIVMLGIGLWSMRSAHAAARHGPASSESRITWHALGIIAVVALSAGAAGFVAMRDSYEESLSSNMMVAARTSADAIGNTLEVRRRMMEDITQASGLAALLSQPAGPERQAQVQALAQRMLGADVAGLEVYGADGALLASAGRLAPFDGSVRHPLTVQGLPASLVWDRGYVLRTEHQLRDGAVAVGRVAGERRLMLLDRLLASIGAPGASEILLCHRAGGEAVCASTRRRQQAFHVPISRIDRRFDLPIGRAVAGESGVTNARDLRGVQVLAAYTPVSGFGLGLVVKNDIDTLYAPLRQRTNLLVLALVLLVALSASALLFQVRPLLAQLVREQRRTRVILENSNDAFVAIGTDGRITDWNSQAELLFGWSAAEAMGHDMASLIIPPAQRPAHSAGFARFIRTGTGNIINSRIEVIALRRDGSEIPVELSVAGFHNGIGYVANAFMRDITERRRLAAEGAARAADLEHERDRAEAGSRAKGEFVANMSHELRTPMNAVLGMAHLLSLTDLKDEQKRYLEMIRESGRSLLGIMNDILDFSKVEAGRVELEQSRFLLCDVLGAVATIMSVNAGEKDIELAIGIDPDVPHVLWGDAMRLQQVLVNLAGNAIKFTEHGEVSLLVELLARDDDQAILQVRVRDTGIGIAEAHRDQLFSPFTQADSSTTRRFGGTGLGLAISRHLVDLMKGSISFDSEVGQGSEFRVALPLRVAAARDDTRALTGAMASLRLLVVDDHPTSRDYIARTIRGWGWEAHCAASGAQAIALVRQASPAYDAVLVDWQMPGMDGVRTMESIRNIAGRGRLPVLLMANAYSRGKLDEAAPAARADAILSKPVTGTSLYDTLHEVLVERARGAGSERPVAAAKALTLLDGARVLMAEDNELNQAVARGILEPAGARLDIVGDGAQAVAKLQASPAAWDLVLMDIQMPVMDGYQATRQIRGQLGLTLPILAVTAGVTEPERASYLAAGMDDLICKPVDADQMVATIARYLNRRQRFGPAAPRAVPAPPQEPATLPVLGIEPLVALARGDRERLGGVAHLLQRVVDDAGREFAQARASWRDGDEETAARLLHALRGGVGSIGAKRFAQASQALEQEIRAARPREQLEHSFSATGVELEAALEAARAWLASYRAEGQA